MSELLMQTVEIMNVPEEDRLFEFLGGFPNLDFMEVKFELSTRVTSELFTRRTRTHFWQILNKLQTSLPRPSYRGEYNFAEYFEGGVVVTGSRY